MLDPNIVKAELAETLGRFKRHRPLFPLHLGVTPGEFSTLNIIEQYQNSELGGIKTSSIGEISCMSRPAVSQMLNTLEKKGCIMRIMAEKDRRVVLVCLTESGKEILQQSKKMFFAMVDRIYEEFGEENTKKFIELLTRYQSICFDDEFYKKIKFKSERKS